MWCWRGTTVLLVANAARHGRWSRRCPGGAEGQSCSEQRNLTWHSPRDGGPGTTPSVRRGEVTGRWAAGPRLAVARLDATWQGHGVSAREEGWAAVLGPTGAEREQVGVVATTRRG